MLDEWDKSISESLALGTVEKGGVIVAHNAKIYGKVESESDLRRIYSSIRGDVREARSRRALTELYKRAAYLVTLTYAPSWMKKFRGRTARLRRTADEQFETTARKINSRARAIGTNADYDETWGGDGKHG